MTTGTAPPPAFGGLLRDWRQARRISQLELSSVSGVSSRHLSFIETGRSRPSRGMVLRLAEELGVPLRERNTLLQAAGYAPEFGETPLDAPQMAMVTEALDTVLRGHLPYPALVFDSGWTMVRGNAATSVFTDGLPDHLSGPGANTMRITLHPDGLAPHLLDHALVRARMLRRIRRQAAASGDPRLIALADECAAYPHPDGPAAEPDIGQASDAPPPADRQAELRLAGVVSADGRPAARTVSADGRPAARTVSANGQSRAGALSANGRPDADTASANGRSGGAPLADTPADPEIVMPFRLRRDGQVISLFSAIATFGTATDLTMAELSIETFFPADAATAAYFAARV